MDTVHLIDILTVVLAALAVVFLAMIWDELRRILPRVTPAPPAPPTPTGIKINQISAKLSWYHRLYPISPQGDSTMAVTGITLGATGTFNFSTTPVGSSFPSGTTFTWTSSDSLTTLTPSADGTSCAIATTATDTATSFTLTCTSSFTPPGGASPVSGSVSVPLLAAAVPTPTGLTINQLS